MGLNLNRAAFIKIIVGGWVALTVFVVWHETGVYFPALNHQMWWHWAIAGSLANVPGISRITIPVSGTWYPLGALGMWLNSSAMYQQPFYVWLEHYGLWTCPLPIAVIAVMWWAY